MKLFKSLLLGSAAGLIAVTGASAADLGVKKPAPVEYVKVCSAFGAGFFYVPGSDACLQISGRVRAEYRYMTPFTRGDDATSFRSRGRLNVDVRQNTAYGLLRAFIRYELTSNSGRYIGVSPTSVGAGTAIAGDLDKAFIQFYTGTSGFFTAGRADSFFDFYLDALNWGSLVGSNSAPSNVLAYTATFGGGFSATLSLEDQYSRRITGVSGIAGTTLVDALGAAVPAVPGAAVAYAGQRLPDVIANVRVDQSWGSAQLSGAVHQAMYANAATVAGVTSYKSTTYGYAILGGLKLNLPMIAAGDQLWLQATYANGASHFPFVGSTVGRGLAVADGYVDSLGNVKKATAWSVVGAFLHNFTPTIQGALMASYGRISYSGTSSNLIGFTSAGTAGAPAGVAVRYGFIDYSAMTFGGQLSWIPVSGFRIGGEVLYHRIDPKGSIATSVMTSTTLAGTSYKVKGHLDAIEARLRFQRDF
jgi:hypothetical protein